MKSQKTAAPPWYSSLLDIGLKAQVTAVLIYQYSWIGVALLKCDWITADLPPCCGVQKSSWNESVPAKIVITNRLDPASSEGLLRAVQARDVSLNSFLSSALLLAFSQATAAHKSPPPEAELSWQRLGSGILHGSACVCLALLSSLGHDRRLNYVFSILAIYMGARSCHLVSTIPAGSVRCSIESELLIESKKGDLDAHEQEEKAMCTHSAHIWLRADAAKDAWDLARLHHRRFQSWLSSGASSKLPGFLADFRQRSGYGFDFSKLAYISLACRQLPSGCSFSDGRPDAWFAGAGLALIYRTPRSGSGSLELALCYLEDETSDKEFAAVIMKRLIEIFNTGGSGSGTDAAVTERGGTKTSQKQREKKMTTKNATRYM